ncbi:MAG: hypothetical protein Q8N82_06835 [Deltaproteobacteria bacterium]|nr:hypothetical protein [Deltaproteobacteria bacterium]
MANRYISRTAGTDGLPHNRSFGTGIPPKTDRPVTLFKERSAGYFCLIIVCLILFFGFTTGTFALTTEEIIKLKKAGVSDETIQLLIKTEHEERERYRRYDPGRMVGSKEITLPDGRKQIIYYSVTDPVESERQRKEEEEKLEKSWDVLKHLIIDQRTNN